MNARQQKFCDEYLRTGDVTQSAIAAGYSPKTAYSIGSENLKKPEIFQYLEKFRKDLAQATMITVERVVSELTKVAFSDIGEVMEVEGNELRIKNLSELSANVRACVSEINETENKYGTRRSVKLHSKLTALDMLMKHLGGYITINDMIDKMTEQQLEELTDKLLTRLNKDEKTS